MSEVQSMKDLHWPTLVGSSREVWLDKPTEMRDWVDGSKESVILPAGSRLILVLQQNYGLARTERHGSYRF